jgi:hypothetical protein
MGSWIVSALVALLISTARLHRSLLIFSTVILAIEASRVAVTASFGIWVVLGGAAVLMYVSDLLREIEDKARELAFSTGRDLSRTRRDVFTVHGRWRLGTALLLGIVLLLVGVVLGGANLGGSR